MATSSIFKNFVIEGEEAVSNFIDLLFSEPKPYRDFNCELVTDPNEIRAFCEGWERTLAKIKAEEEVKENGKD